MSYQDWQAASSAIASALEQHRGGWSHSDLAHFLYNMREEGRSLDWVLWDIGGRQTPEPGPTAPPRNDPPAVPTGLTPRLHVEGTRFVDENGKVFAWRGYSMFLAYRRFCAGENIRPDLARLRTHGVNLIRVFGPLDWKETPDYRYEGFDTTMLGAFFDTLILEGMYCEFVIGCYDFASLAEQRRFAQTIYDIARHYSNVLIQAVNEPHVQADNKPDPIKMLDGVNRYNVLTCYGLYGAYYDKKLQKQRDKLEKEHAKATGAAKKKLAAEIAKVKAQQVPKVADYGDVHVERDDAWHRKARHAQELQATTGKPWVSGEPAKIAEPGFVYAGAKTDRERTPAEAVWHFAICAIYTGGTYHCEAGKWGGVPEVGTLQLAALVEVGEQVWARIGADWLGGTYKGAHSSGSPVDGDRLKIDGEDIWTYSTVHPRKALAVRCAVSAPIPINGWREVDRWGPGGSIVRLER